MRLIDADEFKKRLPTFADIIEDMPEIKAEPVKRGEWESSEKLWETQTARCSNCKAEMYVEDLCNVSDDSGMLPAFCPRCGCDMRGDEE